MSGQVGRRITRESAETMTTPTPFTIAIEATITGDQLGDERDATAPPDQEHHVEVAQLQPGATHGSAHRPDRIAEAGPDQLLEFSARDTDLGLDRGQHDRDRDLCVDRQHLLGVGAVVP